MLPPDRRAIRPLPFRVVAYARTGRYGTPPKSRERGQSIVEFALVLPIMVVLLLAIVDFARIYTTMLSVESAAREAADYGTTLGAGKWEAGTMDTTVQEMKRRACVASSDLSDYEDPDDPSAGGCTNPGFDYCMTPSETGVCGPVDPVYVCEDPLRPEPCTVTVTLSYDFHLFAPFNIEAMGVQIGVPSTISFERDSTFAMTDIDLLPTPAP